MTQRFADIAREATMSKVHDILDSNRVMVRGDTALVSGDSGFHKIQATAHEIVCDCEAGRRGNTCSHSLAAMVAWADHGKAPW